MEMSAQNTTNVQAPRPVQEAPKPDKPERRRDPEPALKVEPAVRVEISDAARSSAAGNPPPRPVEAEVAQKKSEHAQAAQATGKRGASETGVQSLM